MPGVSAAVVWRDGRRWTGTSGLADVAAGRPVRPETEFALASISKTFVAALVLVLVEEGRLDLDEPIGRLLPDVAIPARSRRATVRQLLDHTSGLPDFFLHRSIDRALLADPTRVWTATRALRYVGAVRRDPGEGWRYSNTNYLLLGLAVERLTGRPLATELRTRFFEPLGLRRMYVQVAERPRGPTARAYRFASGARTAKPVDVSDGRAMPFTSVVTAAGAAGSIAGTAEDVARWALALYGGEVLTARSLAEMVAPTVVGEPTEAGGPTEPGEPPGGPPIPYGLGVQTVAVDGWPALGHSGRFLGMRGVVRYLPDVGVAIAVLTN